MQPRAVVATAPAVAAAPAVTPPEAPGLAEFHRSIAPILKANCYECHGRGKSEAGIAFDELKT